MNNEQPTLPSIDGVDKQEGGFGRFKTGEELVKAYASLEKEFTKRSQRLKELEQQQAHRQQPVDWEKEVDAFVAKYPRSRDLLKEISQVIQDNSDLSSQKDCLEKAYLQVLSTNYRSEKDYAEDGAFLLKYAPTNKDVVAKIIEEYVASLNAPVVRTAGRGGEIPIAAPRRPKTVADAGSMALEILKNKT